METVADMAPAGETTKRALEEDEDGDGEVKKAKGEKEEADEKVVKKAKPEEKDDTGKFSVSVKFVL